MDYLYLLLDLGSISIPFLFSFHPKLKFYKHWKSLFPALLITMSIFIVWDVIFTQNSVWGFNESYFLNTRIFSLPLEEWLFFICIPYACVFTHFALLYYFPTLKLSEKLTKILAYTLMIILLLVAITFFDRLYTLVNFVFAIILLLAVVNMKISILQTYFLTFLVMLIPFFMVNGILTGSLIENEVVWYNNNENMNIRMMTIPIEDSIYAFSLILSNLLLMKLLSKEV